MSHEVPNFLRFISPVNQSKIGELSPMVDSLLDSPENKNILRVNLTLNQIQALLREQTGGQLPDALVNQLGFRELGWQLLYDPNVLPMLFVGQPYHAEGAFDLKEAMGTIELRRGVIESTEDRQVYGGLRVAGVGRATDNSRRVMAVEYKAYGERKSAIEIDVSVLEQELVFPGMRRRLDIPIPCSPGEYYHTAGLITPAMANSAGHQQVIRAYDPSRQSGEQLYFNFDSLQSHYRGFRIRSSRHTHTIFFEPSETEVGLSPWQVIIPKGLDKST